MVSAVVEKLTPATSSEMPTSSERDPVLVDASSMLETASRMLEASTGGKNSIRCLNLPIENPGVREG